MNRAPAPAPGPVARRSVPAVLALAALLAVGAGGAVPAAAAQSGEFVGTEGLPPKSDRLVNDYVGALSPAEASALERKLVAYSDSTGSQITVVVVETTGGVAPATYATDLGRAWGVGRGGAEDGVVVLVAMGDREVFIATGSGAEGALTDATASLIVRRVIVPAFRAGNVYGGLDAATTAIMDALAGQFEPPAQAAPGGGEGSVGGILCLLFLVFVVLVVLSSRHGPAPPPSGGSGTRRRRRRGGPGFIVIPGGFGGGGGGFGGGVGGGGGFGGGGFGGFGGGGFSGGGAGGSW